MPGAGAIGAAPTAEALAGLGLPKEQAEASVKAITDKPKVTGSPCYCYASMKVKEGADVAAMTAAVKAYGTASKAAPGNISGNYCISDGEVILYEVFDSPAAMDIHIGFCFPEYIKIVPHADMAEIVCATDPGG